MNLKLCNKIKNFFLILKIRIEDFVRKNKYLSIFACLFVISSIILIIVFASDNDPYSGKITIDDTKINSNLNINDDKQKIAPSFSVINFDLSYMMKSDVKENNAEENINRNIVIDAIINEDIDVEWLQTDENNDYKYEIIDEKENKRKLQIVIYSKSYGVSNTDRIQLKVNNVKSGTIIKPVFKIKEQTSSDDKKVDINADNILVTNTKEVLLTTKILSGTAFKEENFDGRYAPFGIVAGINKKDLTNNSLEGIYFKPDLTLNLNATQQYEDKNESIDLLLEKSKYGVYEKSNSSHFTNTTLPFGKYKQDSSNKSNYVYDSGNNVELNLKPKYVINDKLLETSQIILLGKKQIEVEKNDNLKNNVELRGIKLNNNEEEFCRYSDEKDCELLITDKENNKISLDDVTNKIGEYKIVYKYKPKELNYSISVSRIIKVIDNKEININDNIYKLKEGNNLKVLVGEKYIEYGLLKNNKNLTNFESKIYNSQNELITEIDTSKKGEYKIEYTVPDENDLKLVRNVNVIENNFESTLSSKVGNNVFSIPVKTKEFIPTIFIDGKELNCDSSNSCSYLLNNDPEIKLDTNNVNKYDIIYSYEDKNGFIFNIKSKLYIHNTFELKINDIKSNGEIFYNDDDIIGLGSYFVTAKSPRKTKEDIIVKLECGKSSNTLTNYYVDKGYKKSTLKFMKKSNGNLTEVLDNEYLSYGEDDIILKSEFEYHNGDSNLNNLKMKLPVGIANVTEAKNNGVPFTMEEYFDNVEDGNSEYYIEGIEKPEDVIVKYHICKISKNLNECEGEEIVKDSYTDAIKVISENTDKSLAYLTYEIKEIKPETKIDFRIKLKINPVNAGSKIKLENDICFDQNDTKENKKASSFIYITPFKAKSKVFIGESEKTLNERDINIDGSETSTSTIAIYPEISLPAARINTNILGTTKLKDVLVKVSLPKGVNYVYNENYISPIIEGNNLIYHIKGQKVNEWIEPIYLNVAYDIDLEESNLEFIIETQGYLDDEISFDYSKDTRFTKRNVFYKNSSDISIGQYTNNLSIIKNKEFSFKTKVYNNSNADMEALKLYTFMPVNNEDAEVNFNGSYSIKGINEKSVCSYDPNAYKIYLSGEKLLFEECNLEKPIYAIKTDIDKLESKKIISQDYTIEPFENKTGDKYIFKSIVEYGNIKKKANPLNIEVVSKKITGVVWEDFDSNGLKEKEEKLVEGVTLKLFDSKTNELLQTYTTKKDGKYSFTDLDVGTYYVAAEFNNAKYGLSPVREDIYDKTIKSSFYSYEYQDNEESGDLDDENTDINKDKEKDEKAKVEQSEDENTNEEQSEDENTNEEQLEDENTDEDQSENKKIIIKTNDINISDNTKTISDINLGLALKKEYSVRLRKYITKTVVTNKLGVVVTKDYGKVSLAKLDVKDISNLHIKVIYTIELENIGYYPGYIYNVKDYIPDGMEFIDSYEENKGWQKNSLGYLENKSLEDTLINAGEKKYLNVAFDITRKEAGSFVNFASVEDEDLQILVIDNDYKEETNND